MQQNYTLRALYEKISANILSAAGSEQEARQISLLLLEHYMGVSWKDIALHHAPAIQEDTCRQLELAQKRIREGEPVQYITGQANFYGRNFKVNPAVLIPRRETEELVYLVIQENRQPGLRILDIGTGSGCIAITLQKEMNEAQVHAWDISEAALGVALDNAAHLQASVTVKQIDIFDTSWVAQQEPFDIVVSNPPYVRESEARHMQQNVLAHEPAQALFVPDTQPLIFYEQISALCAEGNLLKPGGRLYFEINEQFGEETAKLLRNKNFEQLRIIEDMQKKNRIVCGQLPI